MSGRARGRRADREDQAALAVSLTSGSPEAETERVGAAAKATIAMIVDTMGSVYPRDGRDRPILPLPLTSTVRWQASLGNMLKREFRDDPDLNPDEAAAVITLGLANARRPIRITKAWFANAVSAARRGPYRTADLSDRAAGTGRGRFAVPLGETRWRPNPESAPIPAADEEAVDWADDEIDLTDDPYDFERWDNDGSSQTDD